MVEAGIETFTTGPILRAPHVLDRVQFQTRPVDQILQSLIGGDVLPGNPRGAERVAALAEVIEKYGTVDGPEVLASLTPDASSREVSEWFGATVGALAKTVGTPEAQNRITQTFVRILSTIEPRVRDSAARQTINGLDRTQKGQQASNESMGHDMAVQLAAVLGVPLKRPPAEITILVPEAKDVQRIAATAAMSGVIAMGVTVAPAKAETTQQPVATATTEATSAAQQSGSNGSAEKPSGTPSQDSSADKPKTVEIVIVSNQTEVTPTASSTPESTPSASPATESTPSASPTTESTPSASASPSNEPTQPAASSSATPAPTPTAAASTTPGSSAEQPTQPPIDQQPSTEPTQPSATEQPTTTLPTAPPALPEQKGDDVPAVDQAITNPAGFAEAVNALLAPGEEKVEVPVVGAITGSHAKAVQLTTPLPELSVGESVDANSIVGASTLTENLLRPNVSAAKLVVSGKPELSPEGSAIAFSEALGRLSTSGLPNNPITARLKSVKGSIEIPNPTPNVNERDGTKADKVTMMKVLSATADKYNWSTHEKEFFEALTLVLDEKGITPDIALFAALGGNVSPESSFIATAVQNRSKSSGIDYFQHSGTRRYAIQRAATKAGVNLSENSLETRKFIIRFTIEESMHRNQRKGGGKEWDGFVALFASKDNQNAKGAEKGARYWRNNFERPGWMPKARSHREIIANKIFVQLSWGLDKVLNVSQASLSSKEAQSGNSPEFPFMSMIDGIAKGHALREKYGGVSGKLPKSELKSFKNGFGTEKRMIPEATDAFLQMNEAFKEKFGKNIPINSASNRTYRPLRAQGDGALAAGKGKSRHGDGTAVDEGFDPNWKDWSDLTKEMIFWLRDNEFKYGFVQPSWALIGASDKYEPWHKEFWGKKAGEQQWKNILWYLEKNTDGNLAHYDGYTPDEQMVTILKSLYDHN